MLYVNRISIFPRKNWQNVMDQEKMERALTHCMIRILGLHRILIWPDIWPIILPDTGYPAKKI